MAGGAEVVGRKVGLIVLTGSGGRVSRLDSLVAALFAQGVSDRSIAAIPNDIKVGALVSITAQGSDKVVAVGYLNQSKAELAKHVDKAVITVSHTSHGIAHLAVRPDQLKRPND